MIKEINVATLQQWLNENKDFQLIDVREPYEYEIANIGGELIPMNEIMMNIDKISRDKPVVIHCRSGKRSAAVIDSLERLEDFTNLYNLSGGILAYAKEIDPSLETY